MTFEEIKQWLEDNKELPEVKSYVDSFKVEPTLEVFKEKITTDSTFRSFMDSENDKHLSKGIETFKTNNLQKLVDEKIKELYPDEDPKDSEVNNLRKEIEDMKKDSQRKELTNLALKKVNEKKLPIELVDLLVSTDEEATLKNIEAVANVFGERMESMVTEKLKNTSYEPPTNKTKFDSMTREKFLSMDFADQQEFAEQKPEAFESMME